MRAALTGLTLQRPRTLDDALRRLGEDDGLLMLAGCTDVYVQLNAGRTPATRYLDLSLLDELRGVRLVGEQLVIGALTTHAALAASPLVQRHAPSLVAAARVIGGVQIQQRGTLGGNVANASPAADAVPVLAASDALVVLRSATAERRVAVADFFVGYRRTLRRPDELIVRFEVPILRPGETAWFRKVGTRAAQAISKVVLAAVQAPAPRLALGSVAPTVVRARRTEAALAGGCTVDEAVRTLADEIAPIDDLRSTACYRQRVAGNLLRRFLAETAHA